MLVLINDPSALKKAIEKRIQSVKRSRIFIDYYASHEFEQTLKNIVNDIENGLLASTACYRVLLEDILNRGNSKAYSHAARHFKKLQNIADEINNFEPLIEHSAFIEQLEKDHGRKHSFWKRLS